MRLGLQRPDIEYHRLDSMTGFLNTDLGQDKELAQIFEEAGCGDLLTIGCSGESDHLQLKPVSAATLRRYLGLEAGDNR